jgi:hypothetical protein
LELNFSEEELKAWVHPVATILCRKVSELPIFSIKDHGSRTSGPRYRLNLKKDYMLGYYRVLSAFCQRDWFLAAWLSSKNLLMDLELLYTLAVPSPEEVDKLVTDGSRQVYHETLPSYHHMKQTY